MKSINHSERRRQHDVVSSFRAGARNTSRWRYLIGFGAFIYGRKRRSRRVIRWACVCVCAFVHADVRCCGVVFVLRCDAANVLGNVCLCGAVWVWMNRFAAQRENGRTTINKLALVGRRGVFAFVCADNNNVRRQYNGVQDECQPNVRVCVISATTENKSRHVLYKRLFAVVFIEGDLCAAKNYHMLDVCSPCVPIYSWILLLSAQSMYNSDEYEYYVWGLYRCNVTSDKNYRETR